jgi:phytoene desaturase
MSDSRPTAAVIGAGFGGLALAIRLQSAGQQVCLYEKRDRPGGRAYVYEQDGFTFDAGPTVITDPAALEELFVLSGRQLSDYVELMPVSPFYRLMWEDGATFDYVNDTAELHRQIRERNPDDVEGYERFLKYSEALYQEGYLKLGTVPFLSFWSMIKAAPQLAKLQSWRSVHAMVSEFVKDEKLREAFSFHTLLVGGDPFKTSSVYALIHALERRGGVWFPRGGTGALVRGMVKLFEDLGGELHLSAPVDRITTAGGLATGVAFKDGSERRFDRVASNADIMHTYAGLLRDHARGREAAEALRKRRWSMSLFVAYFGLKRQHPQLQHHTILFGPRYKGLISEIFRGPDVPEDFSLYLHAPTRTDPGLAPEGCESFYVLSPVPHLGACDTDWEIGGPKYRDRIFDYLEQRAIPGLREDLVTSRIFTPRDFSTELNSHLGSAFSLEPILTQSAWFRTHNRDDRLPNLYFVGAGTHPGAGVPGVVGSAKATAGLMIEDARMRLAG